MTLPQEGELWAPEPGELSEMALSDYRAQLEAHGYDPEEAAPGTDVAFRFQAGEAMLMPVFYNIAIRQDASSEETAEGLDLVRIQRALGLPDIPVSAASGSVAANLLTSGSRTFPDGLEGKLDSGQFVTVTGIQTVVHGDPVAVTVRGSGKTGNTATGTKIKWTSAPFHVAAETVVMAPGLRGGTDLETEEELRQRIRTRRQTRPGSGNWGHTKELAEEADAAVQAAFVYPALGGPGSDKTVLIAAQDPENGTYSRELADDRLAIVSASVLGALGGNDEKIVQSVADEEADISLSLGFAPGGVGWSNVTPWPVPSDSYVSILSVASSTSITVLKSSTNGQAPSLGSRVSWWSPVKQAFVSTAVSSVADSGSLWTIDLEAPLSVDGETVMAGDYLSPGAANITSYGDSVVAEFGKLGPGENTTDPNVLNANPLRGTRRPVYWEAWPYRLDTKQTAAIQAAHSGEILDVEYLNRSISEPTVPGTVAEPPNVLTLRHLGLYPPA